MHLILWYLLPRMEKRMTPSVEKSWHSSVSGGKTAYSSVPGTAVDGCGDRVSGADGVQARV